MLGIEQFFRLIDAYKAARGVGDARVSTLVFNDGSKITDVRNGRDIGTRRLDRAVLWFSENWPKDAVWPDEVPRPVAPPAPWTGEATAVGFAAVETVKAQEAI